MAKQGMSRPVWSEPHPKNKAFVPQLQGKMKTGKKKANPIIAETMGAAQKVWHEKTLTNAHGPLDNDLAAENLEKNIPYADLQDL